MLVVCCLFTLPSCAALPSRYCDQADRIAKKAGLRKELVKTDLCVLTTYHRVGKPGAPLHIYIEGDGYAWVTRARPSGNPTPHTPLVISLAAEDPAANVIYLARPFQYTTEELNPDTDPLYWTKGRFSEPVVHSMDQAVSYFTNKAGASGIDLIGYSGGAAIAVLIAARRQDINSLTTIAGNLDPDGVNVSHGLSPLKGSLNPIDYAGKLKNIPMRHFTGTEDKVIPPFVARSFADRAGDRAQGSVTEVKGATHSEGWREIWHELLCVPLYPPPPES